MVDKTVSVILHFSTALYLISLALLNFQKVFKKMQNKKPKRKDHKR